MHPTRLLLLLCAAASLGLAIAACTPTRGGSSSGSSDDDDDAAPAAEDGIVVWREIGQEEGYDYTYFVAQVLLVTQGDVGVTCDDVTNGYFDLDEVEGGAGLQLTMYRGGNTNWLGPYGLLYTATCGNQGDPEGYDWINDAHCFNAYAFGDKEYVDFEETSATLNVTNWNTNSVTLRLEGPDGYERQGTVRNCGEYKYEYGDDDDSEASTTPEPSDAPPTVPDDEKPPARRGGWSLRFR